MEGCIWLKYDLVLLFKGFTLYTCPRQERFYVILLSFQYLSCVRDYDMGSLELDNNYWVVFNAVDVCSSFL